MILFMVLKMFIEVYFEFCWLSFDLEKRKKLREFEVNFKQNEKWGRRRVWRDLPPKYSIEASLEYFNINRDFGASEDASLESGGNYVFLCGG